MSTPTTSNGNLRWKVDLGRVDMGAYNIPTSNGGRPARRSSGTASSSCSAIRTPIRSCSPLNAETGEIVWKTERDELPSWGTPTVAMTSAGPELVTNASNFIRGYDPRTGKELWRLGGSSKITAPTPIFDRRRCSWSRAAARPERPIFVVRAGRSRRHHVAGRLRRRSDAIAWSRTGRGSYMPTPLVYNGMLYVLANNGVFDAYDLKTGTEILSPADAGDRQRLQRVADRRRREDLSLE